MADTGKGLNGPERPERPIPKHLVGRASGRRVTLNTAPEGAAEAMRQLREEEREHRVDLVNTRRAVRTLMAGRALSGFVIGYGVGVLMGALALTMVERLGVLLVCVLLGGWLHDRGSREARTLEIQR